MPIKQKCWVTCPRQVGWEAGVPFPFCLSSSLPTLKALYEKWGANPRHSHSTIIWTSNQLVCACVCVKPLMCWSLLFYSIITWLILRHLSCYLNWVLFSFSAYCSADYVCPQGCFRPEDVSRGITVRWYPVSHWAMVTSVDIIHTEPLDHSNLAAAITVTFWYQVQPTWFQFTLGLNQPIQVSFIYLMKHMNTVFITFRVCYIQNNGWVGFLFPFCIEIQWISRWHATLFWPYP